MLHSCFNKTQKLQTVGQFISRKLAYIVKQIFKKILWKLMVS